MTKRTSLLLFALCASVWHTVALAAGERVALVIGNSNYEDTSLKLPNPENDANDITAALKRVGFDVIKVIDANYEATRKALRRFSEASQNAEVGLFYYSGHALQVKGENYLQPIDSVLEKETDLDYEAVSLKFVLKQMQNGPETNLVFLDACRNNPLARSLARGMGITRGDVPRGLKGIQDVIGTLIAYATQPDNVALDGTGRNSPFTEAVLTYIEQPGLEVKHLITRVTDSVAKATGEQQIPWASASLRKDFYFVSGPALPKAPPPGKPAMPGSFAVIDQGNRLRFTWVDRSSNEFQFCVIEARDKSSDGRAICTNKPDLEQMIIDKPAILGMYKYHIIACAKTPECSDPSPTVEVNIDAMVKIKGGCFQMGSPGDEAGRDDDERQHRACVGDYHIGRYEVTVGEYKRFVDATGHQTGKCTYVDRTWRSPGFAQSDRHPVVCVSWNDATAYAAWLSKETHHRYRLPTEAEWEYAARGGTTTSRFWGDAWDGACTYANVADCGIGGTVAVDDEQYRPNPNGLHHILGNAWEWTCSVYEKNYVGEDTCAASSDSGGRGVRGGAWNDIRGNVRSATRGWNDPDSRTDNIGFRLTRTD